MGMSQLKILQQDQQRSAAISNNADGTAEPSQYLSEPLLCHKDDPAVWWQMNGLRFPLPAKLARSFLSAPTN